MAKQIYIAALLLVGTSVFAETGEIATCDTKKQKCQHCEPKRAYFCWPLDKSWVSFNAWSNFLYWQPLEDNLEPAGINKSLISLGFQGKNAASVINMDFDYKPGFQLGFGANLDHGEVDVSGEYTWFCANQHLRKSGNQFYPMQLDPGTLVAFLNGITNAAGGLGTAGIPAAPLSFVQTWKLKMNLADLDLGSWRTRGKVLEAHPFIGLRAAWIDQFIDAAFTGNLLANGAILGHTGASVSTHSWAIGPRGGINTNWKIGKGFKFYWDAAGDLLYTNYEWHGQSVAFVPTFGDSLVGPVNWESNVTQTSITTLRTHFDIDLGFRWGVCTCDRTFRFELSAGYQFQVFFDQNMFRHFTTMIEEVGTVNGSALTELIGVVTTPVSSDPNGNLYIQGLKVGAEFAF